MSVQRQAYPPLRVLGFANAAIYGFSSQMVRRCAHLQGQSQITMISTATYLFDFSSHKSVWFVESDKSHCCIELPARWQRPIGCLNFNVTLCELATNYRALSRGTTKKYQAFYGSSPPFMSLCCAVYRMTWCTMYKTLVVCCSVCVAMGCSVLQCVAVCCGVLRCVAVCCSVLQCVVVWCCISDDLVYYA